MESNLSIEKCGLMVSLGVIALYFYGCWVSIQALPDVPLTLPNHPGSNLNLAKEEFVPVQTRPLISVPERTTAIKPPFAGTIHFECQYETIVHPANSSVTMTMPTFWKAPMHNNRLMTREEAMTIGTCIEPDTKGNFERGDDCPPHQRTIYLAIAAHRDFQCRTTLESAFLRAKYPSRLRVGVVDQIIDGEDVECDTPIEPCDKNPHQALCIYKDQVDVYRMDADLAVGPVFARHIGHRLYRGEYYYMQIDAHITYVQDWDEDIVSQFESLHNEMAIQTAYPFDVQGAIDENGHSLRKTGPMLCNSFFEGGKNKAMWHLRHGGPTRMVRAVEGTPQMQPFWAAGLSFSRGHFVVNVPYDIHLPVIFEGEEISIGIRAFTVGYDMYSFERNVCFHHYGIGENADKRKSVKKFWENGHTYARVGNKAMSRLLGIIQMNPKTDPSTWDHTDVSCLPGINQPRGRAHN